MDYFELKNTDTFLVSQKAFIENDRRLLILKFPGTGEKKWNGKWCLPGGLLEMDEDMTSGLIREVKEETGLKVKPKQVFATADFKYEGFIFKDGRKLNVRFIEIGYLCVYNGGDVVTSEEHTEYFWATKDDLKKLDFTPDTKKLIEVYLHSS